jgi:hypothetical protein
MGLDAWFMRLLDKHEGAFNQREGTSCTPHQEPPGYAIRYYALTRLRPDDFGGGRTLDTPASHEDPV